MFQEAFLAILVYRGEKIRSKEIQGRGGFPGEVCHKLKGAKGPLELGYGGMMMAVLEVEAISIACTQMMARRDGLSGKMRWCGARCVKVEGR